MARPHLLLASLLLALCATAQNATISRFKFWTADTAYSIWSDTSAVFRYKGPSGKWVAIPTADTLYNYSVSRLNNRLDIKLDELNVESGAADNSPEKIKGFPERKRKTILADGLYGYIVEVEVVVYARMQKPQPPRKVPERSIEMDVTVETYDGAGKRTAKYKEHTRAYDLKSAKSKDQWAPGYQPKMGLTGNQVMALYSEALENALNTKR